MSTEVQHLRGQEKFVITADEHQSELRYRWRSADILDLYSTFVAPESRGRGLAQKLTEAALQFAREENAKVVPSCWYVEKYMGEHPEYQDLLKS